MLISMLGFSPLIGCVSNKYLLESAIYNATQEIQIKTNVNETIAVINTTSSTENLNMQIVTWFENYLLNTDKYKIVSRQRVDAILKELNFGLTGYISDDSAKSLGKLLGATNILVFDIKNINNKSYLNIQVIETETATLVYSKSFSVKIEETNNNAVKTNALRF